MLLLLLQQSLEKANRQMDAQLTELNGRLADVQKELVEMTAQKNKAQAETADVARRLADSESQSAQLSRLRVALAQQVMFSVVSVGDFVCLSVMFVCQQYAIQPEPFEISSRNLQGVIIWSKGRTNSKIGCAGV